MDKVYCVYILTNRRNTVLYTGVTSNLKQRVHQHCSGAIRGFTSRYNLDKLVYYETADNAYAAIVREKQIKAGSRSKKIALVEAVNPQWRDLYDEI